MIISKINFSLIFMKKRNVGRILALNCNNKPRKKYTLEKLLEGMNESHFHPEIDTGLCVGEEEW